MLRKTQLLRRKNETRAVQNHGCVLPRLVIEFVAFLREFFRLNHSPSKLRGRRFIQAIRVWYCV